MTGVRKRAATGSSNADGKLQTPAAAPPADVAERTPLWTTPHALLTLTCVIVALTVWSWRRWPDLLIDFGHELYIPWRLSEGDVLYRDIHFLMGPASQLWNALLFQIFGVSFTTLIFANLTIVTGITALIYFLFLRECGEFPATVICLVFLCLFGFSQFQQIGNYNYIAPYRHEMTHGFALCLLEIFFLIRAFETDRTRLLGLAGACVGATALMKIEVFLAAAGAACVGLEFFVLRHTPVIPQTHRLRRAVECVAWVSGGAVAALSVGLLILKFHAPQGNAIQQAFEGWRLAFNPQFTRDYPMYRALMGIDVLGASLLRVGGAVVALIGAIVAGVAGEALLRRVHSSRTVLCAVLAIVTLLGSQLLFSDNAWIEAALPLPLVSLIAVVACQVYFLRRSVHVDSQVERRACFLGIWATMSLLFLPKMIFNTQFGHYGFVLAAPATLLLVYGLLVEIPRRLQRWKLPGDVFRAILMPLVASCVLSFGLQSDATYRARTFPVGTGGDVIYCNPDQDPHTQATGAILDLLRQKMSDEDTLLVLPEGSTLNYLLRRRNSTPYLILNPFEMAACGGESAVLHRIRAHPPDWIVLYISGMQDHGRNYFGEPGYGAEIFEWMTREYLNERTLDVKDAEGAIRLRIMVVRRKDQETS